MKKIALTSLLAVVAASAAHASINVIDGNPLYMPMKGHFYSETSLSSHTQNVDEWTLGETFGYGITDRLAVSVNTSMSEAYWFKGAKGYNVDNPAGTNNPTDEQYAGNGNSWNEIGADITWRVINDHAWKLDVMGGFEMGAVPLNMRAISNGEVASLGAVWGDHRPFLDKDDTFYTWTAGVRGGYVNNDWTLSAHANFMYLNTEAFNWGDEEPFWANHLLNLGVAGHWTMSDTWSAYASADYYKVLDHYNEEANKGYWDLTLGLNMNIDTTKYVGAYLTKTMARGADGELYVNDVNGYGFGLKFGIDF